MNDTYDDAEAQETVFVAGVGNLSLKAAVRRYRHARESGAVVNLYRQLGKTPSVFDAIDVERLAELKRFKSVSR